MKISMIRRNECDFPERLVEHVSDCHKIYVSGNMDIFKMKSIAIVGSRNCTSYGVTVAKGLARSAAEHGVAVISGLARGIDSAAHRSALEAGGKTVGVLGTGIDVFYPAENRDIQKKISESGILISEYEPGTIARPYNFPKRNRLISALADAVIVVEASTRSGALITAECAAEQGKHLYAVPGNITSEASVGTNKLIRENVDPLVFFEDVFTDIGVQKHTKCNEASLGSDEKSVIEAVSRFGELTFEEIHHITHIKPSEINGIITILEIKGYVYCEMGKVMIANFRNDI